MTKGQLLRRLRKLDLRAIRSERDQLFSRGREMGVSDADMAVASGVEVGAVRAALFRARKKAT